MNWLAARRIKRRVPTGDSGELHTLPLPPGMAGRRVKLLGRLHGGILLEGSVGQARNGIVEQLRPLCPSEGSATRVADPNFSVAEFAKISPTIQLKTV